MINIKKAAFKKLKVASSSQDMEQMSHDIRKNFSSKNQDFSIFTILSKLNTMLIIHDDGDRSVARYVSFAEDENMNYVVLSAGRSVEQMRFDAACMLRRLAKKVYENDGNFCFSYTTNSKEFSREDKHFACAILMPKDELIEFITQKDKNGKYLYLNENNELTFKNIHVIANHFGVPFNQCASRIFHVFETLRKQKKENFFIEGCKTKKEFRLKRANYSDKQRDKDLKEMVPDYEKNKDKLMEHLIDSLHYRSWDKLTDIAKRKLLVNLVKSDSVNEGVVKSEEEAKQIINNYIASGGVVYDGNLVTKDGEWPLSDEQLVVLGEYELYNKTLERGLIRGIAKSNPRLQYLLNLDYKSAIDSLKERDITNYILDLHGRLFSNLSHKYGETRGGLFRNASVSLSGTDVRTASPRMIPQLMDNLSWRILDILKKNANGELSNSEYMTKVNECIYEMIRMQPFADGNKRTSRLFSNILYQEKGIPYVIVPVKDWDNYVDAWSSDNLEIYNRMMNRLVIDSYQYFYGKQSVSEAVRNRDNGKKIITENRRKKC